MTSSDATPADRRTEPLKTRDAAKTAVLYRMAMPDHLCPFGLKSKALLEWKGYQVEDKLLTTRDETDAFRDAHGVKTTPQTFIDGERVGGFTELKKFFGFRVLGENETTLTPVIAIFGAMALFATAIVANRYEGFPIPTWIMWFFTASMVALAVQKLQDIGGFVNGFLGYDLLARRWVPYGYAYPFLELFAGVGMAALIGTGSALIWAPGLVGIFIGTVGAVSVFKAVYIEKRDLKCACVGGGSNVPLGLVSLTENVVMAGMGIWMIANHATGTTMPM